MGNYERVDRVRYSRWKDDEDEPEIEQVDAEVEELYHEKYSGNLCVHLTTDDGFLAIDIPIRADKNWNEFVDSLPKWE